jgi:hypothetical protein
MFAYHAAQSGFEDALIEAAGDEAAQDAWDYARIGGDYYDESIEIYGVANDARLNEAQQRLVFDAGFSRIWLNHKDEMETYYAWGREFAPIEGHRKLSHRATAVAPTAPTTEEKYR